MSLPLSAVIEYLEQFAPTRLAESWDNVGLLMGDPAANVERVMTCLTITAESAAEAIDERAELIVSHHPLPFHALKRVTTETVSGSLLWNLARYSIAIYSPHTAFDSAREGINQRLAEGLGLSKIQPIVRSTSVATNSDIIEGAGRYGELARAITLDAWADKVKHFLKIDNVQVVGPADRVVQRVAVACGSAGEFLEPALGLECDCLVTGETRFHTCLEAEATGIGLILAGHYASERFGVAGLADALSREFASLTVWASRRESDPLRVR
jgi:dinuclear metal center YbgI/SA1388 family protein